MFSADHRDTDLGEISNNRFDVAADIADLGELGRFNLHERSAGELGKTARNLGLAASRRTDHDDVVRHDLFAHVTDDLLATPAIPERDGDRTLRVMLSDDVFIELRYDLPWRERSDVRIHRNGLTSWPD